MPVKESMDETLLLERVQARMLTLPGQRIIADLDLAGLYGVPTHQRPGRTTQRRIQNPA